MIDPLASFAVAFASIVLAYLIGWLWEKLVRK